MNKTFESEDDGLKQSVKALNRRMDAVESILDKAREVLTLEEAARFLGWPRARFTSLPTNRSYFITSPTESARSSRGANC